MPKRNAVGGSDPGKAISVPDVRGKESDYTKGQKFSTYAVWWIKVAYSLRALDSSVQRERFARAVRAWPCEYE